MANAVSTHVTQPDLRALRVAIASTFSINEIKIACFDLGIEYDNLPGDTLDVKAMELIQYARRHGALQDVVAYVYRMRPNLVLSQVVQAMSTSPATAEERARHRRALRDDRKDIYLVHTLRPAPGRDGWYDILLYLVAHKEAEMSLVSFGEFFLGKAWSNRVFRAQNQDGFVGINISAYGPVLCTCRVVFEDSHETMLERYLDFEMAESLTRVMGREDRWESAAE